MQDMIIKATVLDRIIAHLENSRLNDHRERERRRAVIALRNIKSCLACVASQIGRTE